MALELKEELLGFFIERLFPLHCLGCDHEGAWVCGPCNKTLLFLPPVWQAGPPPFFGLTALYTYDQKIIQSAVKTLKYQYAESIAVWMREQMKAWIETGSLTGRASAGPGGAGIFPVDAVLVPVPLHPRRYAERGFNQAELLAQQLGILLHLPVRSLLQRSRRTDQQAHKTRAERFKNVADAFALSSKASSATERALRSRPIILVDDVTTTGATFVAAARPLEEAGFTSLYGFAFAKEL